MTDNKAHKMIIGRAEWLTLSTLDLPPIMARIDSGAKTSSLHAFDIEAFDKDGEKWVRFKTHTKSIEKKHIHHCEAKILDKTSVKSSNGIEEERYVIESDCLIGVYPTSEKIKLTLTNRKNMHFRILLGREAVIKYQALIDVQNRHLHGKEAPKIST